LLLTGVALFKEIYPIYEENFYKGTKKIKAQIANSIHELSRLIDPP
jgi:hypothetical protein